MVLNVLIVDDEPLIRKGLKAMIDWSLYGFSIVQEFSNGEDVIKYIQRHPKQIDLVISDIRMPGIDGLELIRRVKEIETKEIYFVILSGFYEFEYAKKAIQYQVKDYLLKPIQREDLIEILKKVNSDYISRIRKKEEEEIRKKALLNRSLSRLLLNQGSQEDYEFVKRVYPDIKNMQSIIVTLAAEENLEDIQKQERYLAFKTEILVDIQNIGNQYSFKVHLLPSVEKKIDSYVLHLILMDSTIDDKEVTIQYKKFFSQLLFVFSEYSFSIHFSVGTIIHHLQELNISYQTAYLVKQHNRYFHKEEMISYFEDLPDFSEEDTLISKKLNKKYVSSIKNHDEEKIRQIVSEIYRLFWKENLHPERIDRHLLFFTHKLTNIFNETNEKNEAEFIFMNYIHAKMKSDSMTEECFLTISLEIAHYLSNIKVNSSTDILLKIQEDIEKEYMNKLTLKEFGEKYHINNVYLGQIFTKHFGEQFIDYLNNYRIEQACKLLVQTNERIYRIAQNVGFQSPDYFMKKFLQAKGVTPGKYRIENT